MTLAARDFAALQELLEDALPCPRLSAWDESFLSTMRARVVRYGPDVRLSERQQVALKQIEAKVYAC